MTLPQVNFLFPTLTYTYHALLAVWPLWIFPLLYFLIKLLFKLLKYRKLIRSGITDIDRMDGLEFENYLGWLFKQKCFHVKNIKGSHDYGADLIIRKQGLTTIVQAKRYTKPIGVEAVQQAISAREYYNANLAMVVSNRTYTPNARKLAQSAKVDLWNRNILINQINLAKKRSRVT
jgi:restriction system protein